MIIDMHKFGFNLLEPIQYDGKTINPLKLFAKMSSEQVTDWYTSKLESFGTGYSSKVLEEEELDINIWGKIIDYFENREKKRKVVKLGEGTFNDAKIPVDKYSAWQLYKSGLIKQDWSEDSIKNIEKSSYEILKNLSMDTVESGPIKGLVVGNVQSGKTANMAGLMAMAADNGFNYFIILSGNSKLLFL